MAQEFDECFYDLLRTLAIDELNDLKKYLNDSLGLLGSEINNAKWQIAKADDWLIDVNNELSRLEHSISKSVQTQGYMGFADFLDCIDGGQMGDDMRNMVAGYIDKYHDLKHNLTSALSVQTYMENISLYIGDLETRATDYISVIDDIIKEKITLGQA